jgi:hypothetical protein
MKRKVFLCTAAGISYYHCLYTMKVCLFLVPILAGITQKAVGQQQYQARRPAKVTLLRVEASALGETQQFRVTADSVLVDKQTGSAHTHYAQALTAAERANVVAPFNRVYLSSLQSSYEGYNAPTDGMTFELFIYKGETVKSVRIYKYKLRSLYLFSNRLNLLLPPKYQLEYNHYYFTY